jgi:hypothetical protein
VAPVIPDGRMNMRITVSRETYSLMWVVSNIGILVYSRLPIIWVGWEIYFPG